MANIVDVYDLVEGVAGKTLFSTLMPYILGLLLAAFATVSLTAWYWKDQAGDLADDIAKLKVEAILHEDQTKTKDAAINGLRVALMNCANQRAEALNRAAQAESNLEWRKGMMKTQQDKALNEIKSQKPVVCDSPVPSRTTELLIAAANRANGVGASTED